MIRVSTELKTLLEIISNGSLRKSSTGSTYFADMLLNPLKRLSLILQSIVQTCLGLDFLRREKAVYSNPIIESDHYNVVTRGLDQIRAVIIRV